MAAFTRSTGCSAARHMTIPTDTCSAAGISRGRILSTSPPVPTQSELLCTKTRISIEQGPPKLLIRPNNWTVDRSGQSAVVCMYGITSTGKTICCRFDAGATANDGDDSRLIHALLHQYELEPYGWLSTSDYEPYFGALTTTSTHIQVVEVVSETGVESTGHRPPTDCLLFWYHDSHTAATSVLVVDGGKEYPMIIVNANTLAPRVRGIEVIVAPAGGDFPQMLALNNLISFYRPVRCIGWTQNETPDLTHQFCEYINLARSSKRLGLQLRTGGGPLPLRDSFDSVLQLQTIWTKHKLEFWLEERATELRVTLPELIHCTEAQLVPLMMYGLALLSPQPTSKRLSISHLQTAPPGRHTNVRVYDMASWYKDALAGSGSARDRDILTRVANMPTSFLVALFESGYVSTKAHAQLTKTLHSIPSVISVTPLYIFTQLKMQEPRACVARYSIYQEIVAPDNANRTFYALAQDNIGDRIVTNDELSFATTQVLQVIYQYLFRQGIHNYIRPPNLDDATSRLLDRLEL